jgi:C_GCAxxG_C_C family probable redox protein
MREWRERFGLTILNSLGSSELHYWLSTTEDTPADKLGSSGRSVPGYENVVVDENMNPVPPGTPGELIVRGPLGQLYWRRPDAQRNGVCPPDSRYAGWSRPGLVFVQDADGYFWYRSRTDDMIVTSGYKVPGGEVEEALNRHPDVVESVAIGVPDDERGNVIKAFVVLRSGVSPSTDAAQHLQDFVKQQLEPYKYPRLIEFTAADALPRTSTGKVQRNALRDLEAVRAERERAGADAQFAAAVGRSAEEGLGSGLYCAESVAVALARAQGIETEIVARMATAFCSGMSRTCGTCGALTGAVMGLSLALGRSNPRESVQRSHAATQRLVRDFESEFGARSCDALLGCDLGTPQGQAMFRDKRLHERCARYTTRAAEMAASLIASAKAAR